MEMLICTWEDKITIGITIRRVKQMPRLKGQVWTQLKWVLNEPESKVKDLFMGRDGFRLRSIYVLY